MDIETHSMSGRKAGQSYIEKINLAYIYSQESGEVDAGLRRETKWFYPVEAVREALINSLAHRNWTRFVEIEVSGYSNRLEVISPGALPNSMTVEKMKACQRSPRNTIVMEVLRDYGYVDIIRRSMRLSRQRSAQQSVRVQNHRHSC